MWILTHIPSVCSSLEAEGRNGAAAKATWGEGMKSGFVEV